MACERRQERANLIFIERGNAVGDDFALRSYQGLFTGRAVRSSTLLHPSHRFSHEHLFDEDDTVLCCTVQDHAVVWRKLLPGMTPSGVLTIYFNPKRDGDLKARLKAVGVAQAGAYARLSESDIGRRLLLERLAELEAQLGIKAGGRPKQGGARKARAS